MMMMSAKMYGEDDYDDGGDGVIHGIMYKFKYKVSCTILNTRYNVRFYIQGLMYNFNTMYNGRCIIR